MPSLSYSLHIGVNNVDRNHYQGWDGVLQCCENDAKFFKSVAEKAGFTRSTLLISSDINNLPTSVNLSSFLVDSAKELQAGDLLFITYSGHGGMVQDENFDEDDGQDETWCLMDRQFLDDELMQHFKRFQPGVRIFIISDSCHSGSVSRGPEEAPEPTVENLLVRNAPRNFLTSTYEKNLELYKPLMKKVIVHPEDIGASVLLFAACQDNEKAAEKNGYGLFTAAIKNVVESGGDINNYDDFFNTIKKVMSGIQHPNVTFYGTKELAFLGERPFLFNGLSSVTAGTGALTIRQIITCSYLIIELNPGVSGLTDMEGYHYPTGSAEKIYLIKTVCDTDGVHAWDKAYDEYFHLRKAGYVIRFVEPGLESDWASFPEKAKAARLSSSWTGRLSITRLRGAGAEEDEDASANSVDEILQQMLLLETGQLIRKDPQLIPYLEKAGSLLPENTAAYESFIQLIRKSPYASLMLQTTL